MNGVATLSRDATGRSAPPGPVSPPAVRLRRPTWRDPRLVVGVALVAGSVLLGSVLAARADDTVAVWAVRSDLPAGSAVTARDLVATEVRFAGSGDADRYLPATAPPPEGVRLERDVGAGELLPRAALAAGAAEALVEVPLAVDPGAVPVTVRPGTVVDVWVTPAAGHAVGDAGAGEARLVLDDVPVLAAPRAGAAWSGTGSRQLVVGVGTAQAGTLPAALALTTTGTVVVTRQG